MEIIIKRFKDLDIKELYEILRAREAVFVIEQECFYQDLDKKDYNAYHMYMIDDDKVAAYLRILDKGISFKEISIGRVMVDSEYRGNDLANTLMKSAIDFIEHNMNETKIRISAQLYLKDFYNRLGFEVESEEYIEDSIPHIEMLYCKK
ncbi:GNAT family N-acetyltransferase [Proteocatella sphenisci]|uniref:GNAT family N-acetyltransferase n=1 Tax=Proteocatella sphenisci TaxID=181070 RepID=UPI00048C6D59|nr:GNAT family N-acetyltransferase [Proteocatella sphenisci]